jgi:lipoyl(octanoyl) transferase
MQTVHFRDLGLIEYGEAWQMQEAMLQEGVQAKAEWYANAETERTGSPNTTDRLLFCEHPHVYTLGKSGSMENLLVNDSRLKELNVSFYRTNRGGDITYHGPGQIVVYPVLDLEHFYTDLGKYMRNLEEAVINTIAHYGLKGDRLPGSTGVWLDPDVPGKARKICAMGVRCSRWITIHGLALNVNTDMRYFDYIVPCGIGDKRVTSIQQELQHPVDMVEAKEILKQELGKVFMMKILPEKVEFQQ